MEQNDLVHAWGLDFKIGYCAQVCLLLISCDRNQPFSRGKVNLYSLCVVVEKTSYASAC